MELAVKPREKFGKAAGGLRRQGLIPAELYGHGIPNVHLMVEAKEFNKAFKKAGESTVIYLMMEGDRRPVLIHDVYRNYVSGEVEHIDFYQVRMDEKIRARVPIEFVGEAPAVKSYSGMLAKTVSELEVEAFPRDLPPKFTVDLSLLTELNQSRYVKDIEVPHGVRILAGPDMAVVTVMPPKAVEEVVPQPAADVSQVKVETEEKKAERGKEEESKRE